MKCKFISYEKGYFSFFYNKNQEWKEKFINKLNFNSYGKDEIDVLVFSQIPNIAKNDILELLEVSFLPFIDKSIGISRWECDHFILLDTYTIDNLNNPFSLNTPKPTYISEYI
ncbi:hypothetical protein H2280_08365, partial [Campylobacter sp. 2457A]|nr:hypothetical protein [Campylobacter sp. 2457A]